MSRVKINFFDVLDKYEYCKKCVKSVLGEFSSGVSIYAVTKLLSQIWGPGGTGGPSTGSE